MAYPSWKYQIAKNLHAIVIVVGFVMGWIGTRQLIPVLGFESMGFEYLMFYGILLSSITYLTLELIIMLIVGLFPGSQMYKLFVTYILNLNRKRSWHHYLLRNNRWAREADENEYDIPLYEQKMHHYDDVSTERKRIVFMKHNLYTILGVGSILLIYTYWILHS